MANAPSESFFPGPMSLQNINHESRAELFSLFPELRMHQNSRAQILHSYGDTAREIVRRHELAEVLNAVMYNAFGHAEAARRTHLSGFTRQS